MGNPHTTFGDFEMSKAWTHLKLINNYLQVAEKRNRSAWAKIEQGVRLHEALHHRPHQQEY